MDSPEAGAGVDKRLGAFAAVDRRLARFAVDTDLGSVAVVDAVDVVGIGVWLDSLDSGVDIAPGECFPVAVAVEDSHPVGGRHPVGDKRPVGDTGAGRWPQRVGRHLGHHRAGIGQVAVVHIGRVPMVVRFQVAPGDIDLAGTQTFVLKSPYTSTHSSHLANSTI